MPDEITEVATTPAEGLSLDGWQLVQNHDAVQVRCRGCGYTFVRSADDTVREVMLTAAQHEC